MIVELAPPFMLFVEADDADLAWAETNGPKKIIFAYSQTKNRVHVNKTLVKQKYR